MYHLHDRLFHYRVISYTQGNAKFQVLLARKAKRIIAKQRTYPKCMIETIRDSICETVHVEFLS